MIKLAKVLLVAITLRVLSSQSEIYSYTPQFVLQPLGRTQQEFLWCKDKTHFVYIKFSSPRDTHNDLSWPEQPYSVSNILLDTDTPNLTPIRHYLMHDTHLQTFLYCPTFTPLLYQVNLMYVSTRDCLHFFLVKTHLVWPLCHTQLLHGG